MMIKPESVGLAEIHPGSRTKMLLIVAIMLLAQLPGTLVDAADAAVPKQVMDKIKTKATIDFPGDKSAQNQAITTQTKAYNQVKQYSNKNVPVTIINRIRRNTDRYYPADYEAQLFFLNQQVNTYLKLGIISERLFPPKIVECGNLKWKLSVQGRPAIYRGTVEPGTVDVIYVEVRGSRGLIGQNFGFTNPGGTWEIMVWGDYNIRKKHKEKFYCEKY